MADVDQASREGEMTEKPSERFMPWLDEHYELRDGEIVCRRCQEQVGYLTKHAAVRHGDDIEVMPAVNPKLADSY